MKQVYKVIWELSDGITQDESSELTLYEAIAYLDEKAKFLNGDFNWIQIERI